PNDHSLSWHMRLSQPQVSFAVTFAASRVFGSFLYALLWWTTLPAMTDKRKHRGGRPLAALAAHAPPVTVYCSLLCALAVPSLSAALWSRDITANSSFSQLPHHRSTVIALISDQFGRARDRHRRCIRLTFDRLRNHFDVFVGLCQRLLYRVRIACIRALHRESDHRSGLHIHRMLGFVCQVRAPVFHLGDPSIRVVGMCPVLVGPLL